jgi:hypothetical protein
MNLKGMKLTWIAWSAIEGLSMMVDGLGFGSERRLQQITGGKMVLNRYDLKTSSDCGQFRNKITFIP